ncbi:beta-hydroxylase [Nitzschia inconspicua]|uniref:Beta-hydroxylase n=1 Tax=Nitzschia inconspicua TaxID=303405 RepID=A0A9K3KNE0_9STRA|nr:beta-hydroxylase [Nitzschia inconspicua]
MKRQFSVTSAHLRWQRKLMESFPSPLSRCFLRRRQEHQEFCFPASLSFSSSTIRNSDSSSPICDVVQGPSLLRTPVARPHPSLLYLPGLRSMPFWTSEEGSDGKSKRVAYNDPTVRYVVDYLERNIDVIRDEYLQVAPTLPSDYDESTGGHSKDTLHSGRWDWHSYMNKGSIQGHFCSHFPKTSELLHKGFRERTEENGGLTNEKMMADEDFYPHLLFEGTPFGFCFFSTLSGQSKIQAHTAPMNLRLRLHVPLIVPSSSAVSSSSSGRPSCGIRVGPFVREWKEGSVMVLDDAYNHEVWNETDEPRVILLVDIWHPDIPAVEKKAIVDLFQKAQQDGLWKR